MALQAEENILGTREKVTSRAAPSYVVCHIQKEGHSSVDTLNDRVWFP